MPTRILKYLVASRGGRLRYLPVVVLMPHSRCNCKCVMCDIWKGNQEKRELTSDDLAPHLETFRRFRTRHVVLSGGEPLMHSNLWSFCQALKTLGVRISLLSTGLLLKDNASQIRASCDEVIVSVDGSRGIHNQIRRIPQAYEKLEAGVQALKAGGRFRVTGRCVLQRDNYFDLSNIVESARALALDQISFLAADVSSSAFNRPQPWSNERASEIALNDEEVVRFKNVMEDFIKVHSRELESGFIAESADKLRRLPAYYSAIRGRNDFPQNRCNAPWVSAVVEADGTVRPCFFHKALGNIHQHSLDAILNSPEAITFRRQLDVKSDPVCKKCVCTLYLNPRAGL